MTPRLPPAKRLRKLDRRADDRGDLAERIVSEMYGLRHVGDAGGWYDAVLESTGTKYQVKSTAEDGATSGSAEFRLWETDHRSLVGSDAQGTAWYTFVLFSKRDGLQEVRRMKPSTVTKIVQEFGGWNESGHRDKNSRQVKLPQELVMNR